MADPINFRGTVDWSGENPGISLKEDPDGPFTSVASFFRVVVSPYGRGQALMLMMSPFVADPPPTAGNYCFHDNEQLARYLVEDFVSYFGAWKDTPGLKNLKYLPLRSVTPLGNTTSMYREHILGEYWDIALTWTHFGAPFCFALPPEKSATGKHWMPSTFVPATQATITVNGKMLPGKPVPREIAGNEITTAFLAFSETWIRA
jgi:hypothetical protein